MMETGQAALITSCLVFPGHVFLTLIQMIAIPLSMRAAAAQPG